MTSKPPSFGSVGGSVKFRSGALFAGNIAVTVIYGIGALLGFTMAGSYAVSIRPSLTIGAMPI